MGEVLQGTAATILIGGPAHGRTIWTRGPREDLSTVPVLSVETLDEDPGLTTEQLRHWYKPHPLDLFGRRVLVHMFDRLPISSPAVPDALLSRTGQDVYAAGWWKGEGQPETDVLLRLPARPADRPTWIGVANAAALIVEFNAARAPITAGRSFVLFDRWVRLAVPLSTPREPGWFDTARAHALLGRRGLALWRAAA